MVISIDTETKEICVHSVQTLAEFLTEIQKMNIDSREYKLVNELSVNKHTWQPMPPIWSTGADRRNQPQVSPYVGTDPGNWPMGSPTITPYTTTTSSNIIEQLNLTTNVKDNSM